MRVLTVLSSQAIKEQWLSNANLKKKRKKGAQPPTPIFFFLVTSTKEDKKGKKKKKTSHQGILNMNNNVLMHD